MSDESKRDVLLIAVVVFTHNSSLITHHCFKEIDFGNEKTIRSGVHR
jgi:hypothetical protein